MSSEKITVPASNKRITVQVKVVNAGGLTTYLRTFYSVLPVAAVTSLALALKEKNVFVNRLTAESMMYETTPDTSCGYVVDVERPRLVVVFQGTDDNEPTSIRFEAYNFDLKQDLAAFTDRVISVSGL